MVIDLRYQIVTTVIIFLTLGIGILIGSSMVGQEGLIRKQKELINRLELDFARLRQNNRHFQKRIQNLQEKLEESNEFQKKIFPLVIKGRISDSKVLLTYSKEEFKGKAEKLRAVLKMAGSKEVFIKSFNLLQENNVLETDLGTYDYLIYLGKEEVFIEERISQRFKDVFKKITYLSDSIISSKPRLMNYILKLSGDLKSSRSVQFE